MQPEASTIALTIYAKPGLSPQLSCLRVMLSRVFGAEGTPPAGPSETPPEGRGVAFFEERKKCHTELQEI